MKKQRPIITFDSSAYNCLRRLFGITNAKCEYCNIKITKNNIGGFVNGQKVFCNKFICLIKYIKEIL